MRQLGRFLSLPSPERRGLVAAVLLVAGIRLVLGRISYPTLLRLLDRLSCSRLAAHSGAEARARSGCDRRAVTHPRRPLAAERIAWLVTAASRRLPGGSNCLVHALAAQVLLRRNGHLAELRFGVRRENGMQLEAHAWVESQGRVIIGRSAMAQFTPLSRLEPEPA